MFNHEQSGEIMEPPGKEIAPGYPKGKPDAFIGEVKNKEFTLLHWSRLNRAFEKSGVPLAPDKLMNEPAFKYKLTTAPYLPNATIEKVKSMEVDLSSYNNSVIMVEGKIGEVAGERWIFESKIVDKGGPLLKEMCHSLTDLMFDLKGHPHPQGEGGGRKPSW